MWVCVHGLLAFHGLPGAFHVHGTNCACLRRQPGPLHHDKPIEVADSLQFPIGDFEPHQRVHLLSAFGIPNWSERCKGNDVDGTL